MPTAPELAQRDTRRGPAWSRLSIAVRITLAATGVVAVALAVAGALLVLTLRSGLLASLDAAAEQRASDLAQLVAAGPPPPLLPQAGGLTGAQILGPGGKVVAGTDELQDEPPVVDSSGKPVDKLDGDKRFLVVRGDRYTIVVVSSVGEVEEVTNRLVIALAVGLPVLLALLAGIVLGLVRYTLRTVERLRKQVAAITATDLHLRVQPPPARDEVRALAETMNELLGRLEAAAKAQRRFVADAAHELRSPLAALYAQLEVNLRHPDPERLADRLPGMLEDTARLARLVDDLLALARLDETSRPPRRQLVDLDEVVFAQVGLLRPSARVPLRTSGVSAALVTGDADLLTRVVRNLLDNALRYAESQVEVVLTSHDGQVQLTVADDGPGIPPADAERVFRRFERLQDARDRDTGGSGLGLAIVHDAVCTAGGTVAVEPSARGARLVVRLPSADVPELVAT